MFNFSKTLACLMTALSLVFSLNLSAQAQFSQSVKPKLVLFLVVDMFSYDYLYRFADKFTARGFRYILDHGATFTNCHYKQATTVTAVGHSVISTGAYPWATGIVGNSWYDRRKNADVEATNDDEAQLIGASGQGKSLRSLVGTTFGDQLRLNTNFRSKVISLSLKDRSALFLGGKMANGAYWFDTKSGSFVTSSQYGSLPGWVRSFNDIHYADQYFNKPWQRLLNEGDYAASVSDDYQYEGIFPGDGRQFPHMLHGGQRAPGEVFYATFQCTPFANDMLADLARAAIDQEQLGRGSNTDVLALSFSASDSAGHVFGPYSQEVQDVMLRLDSTIGSLLQYVDQKVGLRNCVVVLTGDHGVTPTPELLKERGASVDSGRIDPKKFESTLNTNLVARLGQGEWVSSFAPPNLYLNLAEIDKQKYRQPEVEALAAKMARAIPGVADVYTAAQFYTSQLPSGPMVDAVKRSYYWGRSGELYVLCRPGYVYSTKASGTSHGSAYSYDTHVPLAFMGLGIQAGRYNSDCSPADVAPTLCALLGMGAPPLSEGRVLEEAVGRFYGPPAPLR